MPANNRLHIAFVGAALLPSVLTAWILWLGPVPDLTADRTALAARDFTALWGAGRLALDNAIAALPDPKLFTDHLRAWFGPGIPDQIWPYPPSILLLAAPLALLPLGWSFPLYTVLTLALLGTVLLLARLPPPLCLATLLSPAVAENALIGQNGALTASLLVGGFLLVDTRPLLAGALLGGLVIKPQMALLLPIMFIAGRRWRAGLATLVSASSLALISAVCFPAAWPDYLIAARPAIQAYLEAPWNPASAQRIVASAFMAARSLGASLPIAYAIQAVVTLLCALMAYKTWRIPADPWRRMAMSAALACAASPWVHVYDLPALAVATVALTANARPEHLPWLALAWCGPALLAGLDTPNNLLIIVPLAVVWVASRQVDRAEQGWTPLQCA